MLHAAVEPKAARPKATQENPPRFAE